MGRASIHRKEDAGFTLLETLLVLAIFSIIGLVLASMLESTSTALIRAKDRVRQFGSARFAFDYMSRNLKQATLNTYWDYKYSSPGGHDASPSAPEGYTPISDIQFKVAQAAELLGDESGPQGKFQSHAVFFQAPLGASDRYTSMNNLLNARGYFIEFGNDLAYRPDFIDEQIAPRYRYRLKEFRPPGENNWIYKELKSGSNAAPLEFNQWFRADSDLYNVQLPYHKVVRNVADNVIALIISPRISEKEARKLGYKLPQEYAPHYSYNSRLEYPTGNRKETSTHQLPPLIKLIMITISEKSAIEVQRRNGNHPPPELRADADLFRDAVKLEKDLSSFETQLKENNIDYRIFQTVVGMQSAKWSDAN